MLFDESSPFKKRVLDFGCGDGFFAKALFGKERIFAGVDIDNDAVSLAEKSHQYKKVYLYDGKKLPFTNSYFSTVFSNCVLEHVVNLPGNLNEICRVMKKDGKFYCSVMTGQWEKHLLGGMVLGKKYLLWMKKIQRHPNLPTVEGWEKIFKKAGFKVVDRTGYVDKFTSQLIEVFHYLSIGSLITHKLFNKWVVLPWILKPFENLLSNYVKRFNVPAEEASAVYFTLEKK